MKFSGKPTDTWAVVVGIESYDGPWDLNGPAGDAEQFMEWLLAKNVPAKQIFALLSPLKANAGVENWCRNQGIDAKPANRDVIDTLLTVGLPERLKGKENQLLFLIWGGHGIVTQKIERRLYYANASADQKLALKVDALQQTLKSQRYAPVSLEIGIIDACANYYEELRSDVEVKGGELSGDLTTGGSKQCFLYGASAGQVAANPGFGKFSNFVLQELKRQNGFPGDFVKIHDAATAWFDEPKNAAQIRQTPMLFVAEITESKQTQVGAIPVPPNVQAAARRVELSAEQASAIAKLIGDCPAMQHRAKRDALLGTLPVAAKNAVAWRHDDPHRDMENIAAATLSQLSSLQSLFDALHKLEDDKNAFQIAKVKADRLLRIAGAGAVLAYVELTFAQQRLLYRASMPDTRIAPEPRSPDHILELLDDAPPRKDGANVMNRMHEFLERVLQKTAHATLDAWLNANVPKVELAAIRQSLKSECELRNQPERYLSIAVNTLELKPNEKPNLHAWLWSRMPDGSADPEDEWEEPCNSSHPDDIKKVFGKLLADACSKAGSKIAIELIVPREQMRLAPENWEVQLDKYSKVLIGKSFPVILRWRDRIRNPRSAVAIDWLNRAEVIRKRLLGGIPVTLWINLGDCDGHAIRTRIKQKDCPECFGLSFAPTAELADYESDLLVQALAGGAPFLCWFNGESEDPETLKKRLADEVERDLDDVPFRLWAERAKGRALGSSVSIMWDDPAHMPRIVRAKAV